MSAQLEAAKAAVRRAASEAGDASGNADSASYLVERGRIADAVQPLEWAAEQARGAARRADEALIAVRALLASS